MPHNKLLTAILNVYGDTRTTFGYSRIDSAAIKAFGPTSAYCRYAATIVRKPPVAP